MRVISQRKREKKIHFRIANVVHNNDNLCENELDSFLASHIIRCSHDDIKLQADKWVEILYKAGLYEKHRASIDLALNLFETARDIVGYCSNIKNLAYVNLHLELAECLFLYNRHCECDDIINNLTASFKETEEKLAIKLKLIYIYQYKRNQMVLDTGAQILNHLDFKFGMHDCPMILLFNMIYYRKRKNRLYKGCTRYYRSQNYSDTAGINAYDSKCGTNR